MSETLHKKYLIDQRQKLKERHDLGEGGTSLVGRHAAFLDVFIISVFNSPEVREWIGLGGEKQACAVLALGGYGRKELSPFSDVDLLFLYPEKRDPQVEEAVCKVLYPLWDVGYDLGYSVQSLEECLELADSEPQFLTALLDARRITGDTALAQALKSQVHAFLQKDGGRRWQEYILEERRKRHLRYGDSAFFLEPHLKEGLGGLRDIHMIQWIGKALYEAQDLSGLEKRGLLSRKDREGLGQSQDFLLRLRNQLHYAAGRKTDLLSFDFQEAMAEWAGAKPQGDFLAVEVFMREVYRHLQRVQVIHQNFFERMVEHPRKGTTKREVLEEGVYLEGDRLYLESPQVLQDKPVLLMKVFWYALKRGAWLSRETIGWIEQGLDRVDEDFRHSRSVSELFLEILKDLKTPRTLLETLLQSGLLTRYLPEWEATVCRTQFDTYHVYTVDIHMLLTVMELKKIGQGRYMKEEPLLFGIWGEVEDFTVLYLAALLHDIGKGQGKNHAQEGAKMIPTLADRLKLPLETAQEIAFLVKHHLLLVETALRRDLNDEELMIRLAQTIGSSARLKMLYLLSYADALATGPRAWNAWKSLLLKELFFKLLHILEKGELTTGKALEALADNQRRVVALLENEMPAKEVQELLEKMPSSYLLSVPPEAMAGHLRLLRQLNGEPFLWSVEPKEELYEVVICCHDRPGLFSRLTGVFALNHINILGAQIFTRSDGVALDIFQVQAPLDPLFPEETWRNIYNQLSKAVSGKLSLDHRLAQKKPAWDFAPKPVIKTPSRVVIDNHGSDFCTIIEVYTQDRLGLLYDITKTLSDMELNITFAKISTKVDQVVDVFYVTDLEGQKIFDEERLAEIQQAILFALKEQGNL